MSKKNIINTFARKAVRKMRFTKEVIRDGSAKRQKAVGENEGEYYYTLRKSAWVAAKSAKFAEKLVRPSTNDITSNVDRQYMFPVVSMARDQFIEKQKNSGKYSFRDMLVIVNPYEIAPLTALAVFATKETCKVSFEVVAKDRKDKEGKVHAGVPVKGETGYAKLHRVPVIGLYPKHDNQVILRLWDKKGNCLDSVQIVIKTGPLPPKMRKLVSVEEAKEPSKAGLIFVYGGETPRSYAFDEAGEIRYFLNRRPRGYGLHPLSGGRFLLADKNILQPNYANPHTTQAYEMDLLGRTFAVYNVENGLHHDACEMTPGGNYLMAGSSLKGYNEDTVLEIERSTGKQLKEFNVASIFDETYKDSFDWAHINTVSYNKDNNRVLICCRNLHTVTEIDWDSGECKWILCHPDFWADTPMKDKVLKPVGDVMWHYQAHAAYEIFEDLDGNPDTRHFIIFDNHWHKRRNVPFFDNDEKSYVRIYTVNEKEMTVRMDKNFPSVKSKIRSNGLLMTDKDRLMVMSGYLEPVVDGHIGMIYEYAYSTGEVMRRYGINKSFYRAYELWADMEELAKPMPVIQDYVRGKLREMVKIDKPQFGEIKTIEYADQPILSAEEESSRSYDIGVEDDPQVSYESLISYYIREDIFYFRAKDHLVEKVYFLGEKENYFYDLSMTTQHNETIFGVMAYSVAIPLSNLEKDNYKIYLKTANGIFDSQKFVQIK